MTDNAAPGLNKLCLRFGHRVRFVMVNVREAHPGKAIPQPRTLDEKMAHAAQLRDLHGFEFEVAVDDVDGTLHRALGSKPNSAYVLGASGTILFRAHWANDTNALTAALNDLVGGESPFPSRSGGLVKPMLHMLRNIALFSTGRAAALGQTCGAWRPHWQPSPLPSRLLAPVPRKAHRPAPAMFRTAVDEALRINETALPDRNSCLRLRRLRDLVDVNSAAARAKDELAEKWQPLANQWRAKQLHTPGFAP